jgi:hypothetical protein
MKPFLFSIALTLILSASSGFSADPEATPRPYPLTTCVVSNDELGSMGKPVVFDYEGQEIKLCCKQCKKQFDKAPEKFVKQMQVDAK